MKHDQEQVREALMRLSMCARKQCGMCKHKDRPDAELPSEECKKRSVKNMNILADVCLKDTPKTPQTVKERFKKKHVTICWRCANNCGGCSWSKNFTPVEGWTAVPTELQARGTGEKNDTISSYDVYACPEFELMERLKKGKKKNED